MYAYDLPTGKILWTFNVNTPGTVQDSPYGQYQLSMAAIGDNKIYLFSSEHSPTKPLWRGSSLRCIDANTGTQTWKIDCWANGAIIADGDLSNTQQL